MKDSGQRVPEATQEIASEKINKSPPRTLSVRLLEFPKGLSPYNEPFKVRILSEYTWRGILALA